MRYEVAVHIEGDTELVITAGSAEEARKIAKDLEAEVDIAFPPEAVDTSGFERSADLRVDGVVEIEEEA